MQNYRYTPFNVLGIIIFVITMIFILRNYQDFHLIFTLPIFLALILIGIDYFFQKKDKNFKMLFVIELVISIGFLLYFLDGMTKAF
jgi:hypothetical protein